MNPQSWSQPREGRKRRARVVTIIAAAAGLALLAACGSSPSSTGSGGSPNTGGDASGSAAAKAVAYTQCMRTHGVPAYPGPNSSGDLPKLLPGQVSQLGVTQSKFTAAGTACQSLWPYQAPTQAQEQQVLVNDLKFARCMRSHGLPDFPDPVTDPKSGRVEFVLSLSRLGSPRSPLILAKAHACESVLPPNTGLPLATEAP